MYSPATETSQQHKQSATRSQHLSNTQCILSIINIIITIIIIYYIIIITIIIIITTIIIIVIIIIIILQCILHKSTN